MDFDESPELRTLRGVARKLATAAAGGSADPPPGARAVWSALRGQGWGGLAVPERYGGSAADLTALAVVSAECARAGLPTTLRSTMTAGLLVDRFASDDQRHRWLPRLIEGCPATVGLAGSARLLGSSIEGELGATPDLELAAFVVVVLPRAESGSWQMCVLSPRADQVQLSCSVSGRSIGRVRGSELAPDHVDVGPRLDDRSARLATDLLTVLTAADLVGAADGLLARTVDHVCTREQFGRPLGAFQAVQHHVADMAAALEGARLLVDEALTRLTGGEPAHREVAAAKAYAGRAATAISLLAHQLHGAIGYVTESSLYLLSRRVQSDALLAGTAAEHLDELAERYRRGPSRTLELDALDRR
jgi:alkylation response protein AidB-like acyl-CoA dehydrogenase